ncbi:plasmid maintenance system killer protein [Spirosoma oryzae]|uniref:Plasmid maintenance system killer protein n=1 Tax=Spirosoma oryzae TaxID=1469603 RepID=A0A2T0T5A9_9BACT|nr:type II toxin-antitoxin system RelE/ParE family toxin [Spirosoma oryzae]PRY40856.1 plasmid maintenance system killer protein [Spirosoma oryzae]
MTIRFATQQLEDWFVGDYQGKQPFSEAVLKAYQKTIRKLDAADSLAILRQNKSLNFHPLKRDLEGKYAVRVNMQYRIILSIDDEGEIQILLIEQLTDYH